MLEQAYEACQPLTAAQRQDFYDWCATQYGYAESCRYCGYATCSDPWNHTVREINWDIYVSLRDGVNTWRTAPVPSVEFFEGFYGNDHE